MNVKKKNLTGLSFVLLIQSITPIVDRWSTDISTDCRPMHRPICNDQLPVKYRSSIGQVSVMYRSSIGQISVKHRSNIGQVSVKYRSSIGQVPAEIGSLTDHIAQKRIG